MIPDLLILVIVLLIVGLIGKLIVDSFFPAGQAKTIGYLIVGLILLLILLGHLGYPSMRLYP